MMGTGDVVASSLLAGLGAWAWLRRCHPVEGKTWAFRIVPPGMVLFRMAGGEWPSTIGESAVILVAYAFAVYRGGWRLEYPKNRYLNGLWWMLHVVVYFFMAFVLCGLVVGIVLAGVFFSPVATEGRLPLSIGVPRHFARNMTSVSCSNPAGGLAS